MASTNNLKGIGRAASFSDNFDVVFSAEHRSDAGTHDLMVIKQEDPDSAHLRLRHGPILTERDAMI